ncbi:uncharacterized protein JN550_012354 [Neoarthrinium moseri]|uniref:uncharacterized protein n=1 Tax=Neoarthrinium moseri TaxID=1658444 RepID=UPI001FDD2C4A|nr:uncharacterized protein JN550_012354 [Neoarthrinium moseri]KAI1858895.1 hypothetical protein JN550_012354 [Neoarthrinium moseri]
MGLPFSIIEHCKVKTDDFFLAFLPIDVDYLREGRLDELVSQTGFLIWRAQTTIGYKGVCAKEVSPRFDPNIVGSWLNECQSSHVICQSHHSSYQPDNLIDCQTRQIISVQSLETPPTYIALSYVWGKSNKQAANIDAESVLPATAVPVIEDTLEVAVSLGYRYVWIDKYCVDQRDGWKKHEQIMHMDSIYSNAALTIVAAAGEDESHGLPGVGKDRKGKKAPFQHDNFSVSWVPPSPRREILGSRWATRGWTFQEAVLSPRCLVFTQYQMYFECRTACCYESLNINIQKAPNDILPWLFEFMKPRLFVGDQGNEPGQHHPHTTKRDRFMAYVECAEKYSRRTLSYDEDSLNAFAGMIKRFEATDRLPVRHIWGVPFFDPRDDTSPSDIVDYVGFLMAGLSWWHDGEQREPRRRKGFPSWSWTGWEGGITWPRAVHDFEIQAPADYMLASIQLSFEDGSTRSIPDVRDNRPGADKLGQYPKALLVQTVAVPGKFLSMQRGLICILDKAATWRPSKPGVEESKVVQNVQSGAYKALRLGSLGDAGFVLVVKKRKGSFYRVGILELRKEYLAVEELHRLKFQTFKLK